MIDGPANSLKSTRHRSRALTTLVDAEKDDAEKDDVVLDGTGTSDEKEKEQSMRVLLDQVVTGIEQL